MTTEKQEKMVKVLGVMAIIFIGEMLDTNDDINDLGQAICEEQQNTDFDYYSNGVLHCKEPVQTEKYDGIKIQIKGNGGTEK